MFRGVVKVVNGFLGWGWVQGTDLPAKMPVEWSKLIELFEKCSKDEDVVAVMVGDPENGVFMNVSAAAAVEMVMQAPEKVWLPAGMVKRMYQELNEDLVYEDRILVETFEEAGLE